jgi:preprotein translocase subunit SecG
MQILNIFHVLIAIAMVAFVLIQRGPGATAGAAFGSGASGTVFGSRGAGSFLSRTTWILAALFCLISLAMAVAVSRDVAKPETDLGVVGTPAAVERPAEEIAVDTPVLDDADQGSDLPVLDTADDALDSGDLPQYEQEESGAAATDEGAGSDG